ncbi:U3 snoRNP protein [Dimargaris xerosporica]|nr:U3 snoRNP protein [Dimargaris xerosporica]
MDRGKRKQPVLDAPEFEDESDTLSFSEELDDEIDHLDSRNGSDTEHHPGAIATDDESDGDQGEAGYGLDDDSDMDIDGHNEAATDAKPDTEDPNQLGNMANLLKGNIHVMQMEEVLKETRLPYHKLGTLQNVLRTINDTLKAATSWPAKPVAKATQKLQKQYGVAVPFPPQCGKPSDCVDLVGFEPPSVVNVVGSFPLQTACRTRHGFNVDLIVEMPASLFTADDRVNHRYYGKRAYYLAVIAGILAQSTLKGHIAMQFDWLRGDTRRPILLIRSRADKSEFDFSRHPAVIRIIPTLAVSTFSPAKLGPSRCLVNTRQNPAATTPLYNAGILEDMLFSTHLAYMHQLAKACQAFSDTWMLGKVWLSQRGYRGDHDSTHQFTGFTFGMLLAYLLEVGGGPNGSRLLSKQLDIHALFRGTLQFLARHDFHANPLSLCPKVTLDFAPFQAAATSGVLLDPSGRLNLLQGVTAGELQVIQHQARLAVAWIDDEHFDHIFPLFINRADDPLGRFDHIFVLPNGCTDDPATMEDQAGMVMDRLSAGHWHKQRIQALLQRALQDRVHLVAVEYTAPPAWSVDASIVTPTALTLGLVLNPKEANRLVDRGPSPKDPQALQAFIDLWGDRSDLRRFKDGSIVQSVVWECPHADDRGLVVCQAVEYLLRHHFAAQSAGLGHAISRLHTTIQSPLADGDADARDGSFLPVQEAFEKLSQDLCHLSDLPLDILTVRPVSPALRYTSLYAPQPIIPERFPTTSLANSFVEPIEVQVVLEGTTHWTNDLVTIQKLKTAFYLKIGRALALQDCIASYRVQSENYGRVQGQVNVSGYLDVLTTTGFVFRIHVYLKAEKRLLQVLATDAERDIPKSAQGYLGRLLHRYNQQFVYRPWHHVRVTQLCRTHPSLSQTIRLVKRWANCHLLGASRMPPEALELAACSVYLDPAPWTTPATGLVGFFRVLNRLATFNWQEEPLFVNFERGTISEETHMALDDAFDTARRAVAQRLKRVTKAQRKRLKHRSKSKGDEPTSAASVGALGPDESNDAHHQARLLAIQNDGDASAKAMYIAASRDLASDWWTSQEPRKVVLKRLQLLAAAALKCARQVVLENQVSLVPNLFATPLTDYDFVIHLNPEANCRGFDRLTWYYLAHGIPERGRQLKPRVTKLDSSNADESAHSSLPSSPVTLAGQGQGSGGANDSAVLRVGFDPLAAYVQELQEVYGHLALFFYDDYGGQTIGGLWFPGVQSGAPAHSLSANLGLNTAPVSALAPSPLSSKTSKKRSRADAAAKPSLQEASDPKVTLNLPAILAEMERLGEGLVQTIEVPNGQA